MLYDIFMSCRRKCLPEPQPCDFAQYLGDGCCLYSEAFNPVFVWDVVHKRFVGFIAEYFINNSSKLHYFQLIQKSPFEIRPKNLAEDPCIRKLLILFLSGTFFIKGLLNLLASPRFVPLCYLVFKTKTCFQKVKKMKPILRATEKTLIPQEIRDNFPNFYSLERLICIDVRQASAVNNSRTFKMCNWEKDRSQRIAFCRYSIVR